MASGTLLPTLRAMVRAEIGETSSTTIATQKDASVNTLLSNAQKLYSTIRDWPFLQAKWDVACAAGSRYKTFPVTDIRGTAAALNRERPFNLSVLFNRIYIPLEYGIGNDEFVHRNSDLLEAMDPIQRWRIATNVAESTNTDQFEIWPIPISAQTVRFTGERQLASLSAETDKADLDDLLLVYSVSLDLLSRNDERQMQSKLMSEKLKARLSYLTSSQPTRDEKIILGRNTISSGRRNLKVIAIAGS